MRSVIDKNVLFQGTEFSQILQEAIYKDILYMRNFFPDIYPYPYRYPDHTAVLLQGKVPIRITNAECSLPLSMAIPSNFPNSPPRVQIPVQASFPLNTSNILQPNGLILTQYFFQWIPCKSQLVHFVNAIVQYFSANPPFTLENGRRLVPNAPSSASSSAPSSVPNNQANLSELQDQATAEAISLIESISTNIKECEDQYCDDILTCDMAQTIDIIYHGMQDLIQKNQKKLDALESQQLPDIPIDPELEKSVKLRSRNQVFENTKSELQNWYENNIIPLDDFLQSIRDLSRDHFQNDIYPSLS